MHLVCLYALAACTFLPAARSMVGNNAGDTPDVSNQYIVKFKSPSSSEIAATFVDGEGKNDKLSKVNARFQPVLPNTLGVHLSAQAKDKLLKKHGSNIEYIEPERICTIATATEPAPGSWGLNRTSTSGPKNLVTPAYYYEDAGGAGVVVYVVDTGIETRHSAFLSSDGRTNRAQVVWSYDGRTYTDDNGHGTHVSGTIGAKKWGIAPKVTLRGVKVLSASGSGTTSYLLNGLAYVSRQKAANPNTPMIVSMSLGFGAVVQSVDDAVANLIKQGVVVVIAAGNSNTDACNNTPSRAPGAIAVAATDINDNKASWSSWGPCVAVNAPGVSITSLWISGSGSRRSPFVDNQTNTISGTSMATPHVSGVAALLMSAQPALNTPALVRQKILSIATANTVIGATAGTTLAQLFNGYSLTL